MKCSVVSGPYREYMTPKQASKLENVKSVQVIKMLLLYSNHIFTLLSLSKPLQWEFSTPRLTVKCWTSAPTSMFVF